MVHKIWGSQPSIAKGRFFHFHFFTIYKHFLKSELDNSDSLTFLLTIISFGYLIKLSSSFELGSEVFFIFSNIQWNFLQKLSVKLIYLVNHRRFRQIFFKPNEWKLYFLPLNCQCDKLFAQIGMLKNLIHDLQKWAVLLFEGWSEFWFQAMIRIHVLDHIFHNLSHSYKSYINVSDLRSILETLYRNNKLILFSLFWSNIQLGGIPYSTVALDNITLWTPSL